jgi:hypothetical protein
VDFLNDPALLKIDQISMDGHLGNIKELSQLGNGADLFLLKLFDDSFSSLLGDHLAQIPLVGNVVMDS